MLTDPVRLAGAPRDMPANPPNYTVDLVWDLLHGWWQWKECHAVPAALRWDFSGRGGGPGFESAAAAFADLAMAVEKLPAEYQALIQGYYRDRQQLPLTHRQKPQWDRLYAGLARVVLVMTGECEAEVVRAVKARRLLRRIRGIQRRSAQEIRQAGDPRLFKFGSEIWQGHP